MFSSRWKKEYGFGWSWVFDSEIIHSVADKPEGPYHFQNVALPRRGAQYFDGMNTHNTCIKEYNGKFYLYYMGCTYHGVRPNIGDEFYTEFALETWNRKRVGVAVADDINGEFVRRDTPLLEPRDCSYWDCTITTNPSVAIQPDGKTYMIYKSRRSIREPLQLGIAVTDSPDGEFKRVSDKPIFDISDHYIAMEDPFIWYDAKKKKFCVIAKDDTYDNTGFTGEWGGGFYAESDDCINFTIGDNPTVYTRHVEWADGRKTLQCNLERPSVLFDENGEPTHIFCASGYGDRPYVFDEKGTFIACIKLEKK